MKGKRRFVFGVLLILVIGAPAIANVKAVPRVWAAETIADTGINSSGRWRDKHTDGSYTKNNRAYINGRWHHFDTAVGCSHLRRRLGSGAIYLGDNCVIYADSPRWGVRITDPEHPGRSVTYRRVW